MRLNQTKAFDKLNRLTEIVSTPQASGALPMAYSYQYNDANQRIQTRLADGSYWLYEYDALGQVISGKRFWADGTPVAGQQFEYGFDDIGNRKSTKAGGDQSGGGLRSATYGANGLNQYTNRTVPGAYDILGAATATNSVTVNGSSPYQKGEYFWKEVTASNGSGPVWQTNTVSVSGGSTVGGNVLVPPATQTFTHDLDGNLTADLVWNYVWDGENRLIQMSNVTTVASAARRKLDFNYDHQGRRFRKVVSTWNGSAWVAAQTNVFHYHGWNVLGDFVSTGNYRHYLWGNDLSGSLQGAGGVGGLIAVRETNQVHFVAYDGNGNVAGLVNAADGAVSANYEYGPFGESIRASGGFAKNNPYRFSTKYQDGETDLLYYGFRYYSPSTGRWLSRDPLDELGFLVWNSEIFTRVAEHARTADVSLKPYTFVSNNAISLFDPLGLKTYVFGWQGFGSKNSKGNQKLRSLGDAVGAIEIFHWDMDVTGPKRIREAIKGDCDPKIKLFGWSWGAVTSLSVARQLATDDIKIDVLFTFDPVFLFRSVGRNVPENVAKAYNYYQTSFTYTGSPLTPNPILEQADLNPDGKQQVVIGGVVLPIDHGTILWAAEAKFLEVMGTKK